MSGLKHAGSFRDLIAYQKSRQLQRELFKITKSFPKEEMFSLTDLDCEYIDQKTSAQLVEKCLEVGRMLGGMMDKAEMFCCEPPRTAREDSAVYFTESDDEETDN